MAGTQPVMVEDAGAVLKGAAEELKLKLRGELLFAGGAAYEAGAALPSGRCRGALTLPVRRVPHPVDRRPG